VDYPHFRELKGQVFIFKPVDDFGLFLLNFSVMLL